MLADDRPLSTRSGRPRTRWLVRPPAPPAAVERLMRDLTVPPTLAAVLWGRGFDEDARSFLEPDLILSSISDLDDAAARLQAAIDGGKRILIHGDYDADGISGTAVLTLGLRALGGRVTPFIPNRLTEGYGIYPDRVPEHAAAADLFVTVDCGISNLDEIRRLREAGVEVIVSDHHHPGEVLPDCLIVHPTMSPLARAGGPELTGAGVAYHLLWALHVRLGLEAPTEFADIATIGTIADVAPLLGENRALIRTGLAQLADSRWPGLRAAVRQLGLRGEIRARDVAFILAPRLNAAGRLGEADLGLELLTTASERRANELAAYLDARNHDRRRIQDEMLEQALAKVDRDASAIVVDHEGWHAGVMGIVASKLVERFYKPVFIIAGNKGSVRSTPGVSAVEALRAAAPHLERFGGHRQAAGFSLKQGQVEAFRGAIEAFVATHPLPTPTVVADALLAPDDVGPDLLEAIQSLEPFGEGHPSPTFAMAEPLEMARAVGRNRATLQLRLGGIKGVAWQQGELAAELPLGHEVGAMFELRENVWQNRKSIEFVARGVRPAAPLGFEEPLGGPLRLRRGRPPMPAMRVANVAEIPPGGDGPLWLTELPLGPEPIGATNALIELLEREIPLHFDLDAEALGRVAQRAADYPTPGDVRRAFIALRKGRPLPCRDQMGVAVRVILGELDLLDGLGRARSGQRRDPYSSDTLVAGLLERYRLRTFHNAYRLLDDAAFCHTVATLFTPSGQPRDSASVAVRY